MANSNGVTLFWQPTKAQIASIVLDASIKEVHHSEVDSTDSPVEQGVDVTDHLRAKPDTVTITGMVTNFPLNTGSPTTDSVQITTAQGTVTSSNTSAAQWVPGTAENAYAQLLALKGSATLVTVVTALRVYSNMALKSLDVPRDAAIGESLQFTAVLKEIQIVQNQTIQIARAPPQQPNQNIGKQATQPVPKSIASSLADTGANSKNSVLSSVSKFIGGQASP